MKAKKLAKLKAEIDQAKGKLKQAQLDPEAKGYYREVAIKQVSDHRGISAPRAAH